MLRFYQQRPIFALKIHPKSQRPKRTMKAKSQKLQIHLLLSLLNVKSSINANMILKQDRRYSDPKARNG